MKEEILVKPRDRVRERERLETEKIEPKFCSISIVHELIQLIRLHVKFLKVYVYIDCIKEKIATCLDALVISIYLIALGS